jgi:transcription initiation factor IIE alpha subunit
MKPLKPGPTKRKFVRESINALSLVELVYVLTEGEYTRDELCELVGVSDSCMRTWLRYLMRPEKKLVYICERRRTSKTGACKLIYTWGPGIRDVPVVRKSVAQTSRDYRRNKLLRMIQNVAR